jgi:hypothetical protein
MKFERGLERRALAFRRSLVPSVPINFVLINLDRTSFVYELRAVNRQITDCKHSFLRGDFERGLERKALAFRGRSGSLLGALAPVGSPLDAYSRRSLVPSVPINWIVF